MGVELVLLKFVGDLFSKKKESPIGVPLNLYGKEHAKDGDNYAGIVAYSYNNKQPRTYLQSKLMKPLTGGIDYCVKFHLSLSDLSKYAIDNSHPEIRTKLKNKSAKYLCKLRSKTFDFIYSKEMLPHMCLQDIKKCIKECNRISKIKQNIYFIIQSVKEPKKQLAEKWDPTQKVLMTRSEWVKLLKQNNYHGSYCIKSQF